MLARRLHLGHPDRQTIPVRLPLKPRTVTSMTEGNKIKFRTAPWLTVIHYHAKYGYKRLSGWYHVWLQKVEWLIPCLVTKCWVVDTKFGYEKLSDSYQIWLQKVERLIPCLVTQGWLIDSKLVTKSWMPPGFVTKGWVVDNMFGYKRLGGWYQVWLQKAECHQVWYKRLSQ